MIVFTNCKEEKIQTQSKQKYRPFDILGATLDLKSSGSLVIRGQRCVFHSVIAIQKDERNGSTYLQVNFRHLNRT